MEGGKGHDTSQSLEMYVAGSTLDLEAKEQRRVKAGDKQKQEMQHRDREEDLVVKMEGGESLRWPELR